MLHEGHRSRLRKKFREGALEPHEFVELLLFFSIPRMNTNETAHRLMDRFGSFRGVLNADEDSLCKVEGVGPQTAFFLKVIAEAVARYRQPEKGGAGLLRSKKDLKLYVTSLFIGSTGERVYALYFGANKQLLSCECIAEGFASGTTFSPGRVLQTATNLGAVSVLLAHNHPNGMAVPSETDIQSTKRLSEVLNTIGVSLMDHIIVVDDECCFMLQRENEKSRPAEVIG